MVLDRILVPSNTLLKNPSPTSSGNPSSSDTITTDPAGISLQQSVVVMDKVIERMDRVKQKEFRLFSRMVPTTYLMWYCYRQLVLEDSVMIGPLSS
jgi:hypothetical protein